MSAISTDIESIRQEIVDAKRVVVFTGAGISAESGIPTFRSKDGIWSSTRSNMSSKATMASWPGFGLASSTIFLLCSYHSHTSVGLAMNHFSVRRNQQRRLPGGEPTDNGFKSREKSHRVQFGADRNNAQGFRRCSRPVRRNPPKVRRASENHEGPTESSQSTRLNMSRQQDVYKQVELRFDGGGTEVSWIPKALAVEGQTVKFEDLKEPALVNKVYSVEHTLAEIEINRKHPLRIATDI